MSDTRERILDAAERLFMAYGYDGTSMRQVTGEAAVNLAAVHYHFGSKEALLHEVFRRRLVGLNEERIKALDVLEVQAKGQPLKPSQILDGFFGTMLRMAKDDRSGGQTFLRLLGRTQTDPSEFIHTFLASENKTVMERYSNALFRALPDVPRAEIIWRFHFMLGATSYAIAGTDALHLATHWPVEAKEGNDRYDWLESRLMAFLVGGLRAPLPDLVDRSHEFSTPEAEAIQRRQP